MNKIHDRIKLKRKVISLTEASLWDAGPVWDKRFRKRAISLASSVALNGIS
jgi:hypothetical protein